MRESDDVKPASWEIVDKKLKEVEEGIDRCFELLRAAKKLMGVVEKRGSG